MVALTKCDLADPAWLALVEEDVRALVAGTFLEGAPRSSGPRRRPGRGSTTSKASLRPALRRGPDRGRPGPVPDGDRPVVHGRRARDGRHRDGRLGRGRPSATTWNGSPTGRTVRVRGLQRHDRPVDRVGRGARAAINLVGRPSRRGPPGPRAGRARLPGRRRGSSRSRSAPRPTPRGRSGIGAATGSTSGRPRSRRPSPCSEANELPARRAGARPALPGRAGRGRPRPAVRAPRGEPAGDPRRRPGAPAVGAAGSAAATAPAIDRLGRLRSPDPVDADRRGAGRSGPRPLDRPDALPRRRACRSARSPGVLARLADSGALVDAAGRARGGRPGSWPRSRPTWKTGSSGPSAGSTRRSPGSRRSAGPASPRRWPTWRTTPWSPALIDRLKAPGPGRRRRPDGRPGGPRAEAQPGRAEAQGRDRRGVSAPAGSAPRPRRAGRPGRRPGRGRPRAARPAPRRGAARRDRPAASTSTPTPRPSCAGGSPTGSPTARR